MELREQTRDALAEAINIAFARTAASLSTLTGNHVELDVPRVQITPIEGVADALADFSSDEVASVLQPFTGPVSGDALLVLSYTGAVRLADLVADEPTSSPRLTESSREVLTEIGNILLNSCLGVFGNLLELHVTFAVPRLFVDLLTELVSALIAENPELKYALVIHTGFRLRSERVSGYLVMILGVGSITRLIEAVDRWEASIDEPPTDETRDDETATPDESTRR
jgi:chemotaxis protein CheC